MNVAFKRTGVRRYAVIVTPPGGPAQAMDPAPGYDDDIPHDLVHYVVEAELGLTNGVYGRAERGGGTFITTAGQDLSPRERARRQRKQQKRERALRVQDESSASEMVRSERLAALCDVAWRRKHGQRADLTRMPPVPKAQEAADVERVVARLDELAPAWRALPIDAELVFEWPSAKPHAGAAVAPPGRSFVSDARAAAPVAESQPPLRDGARHGGDEQIVQRVEQRYLGEA